MRPRYRRRSRERELREIPPWYANPIVFVPVSVALALALSALACALIVIWAGR